MQLEVSLLRDIYPKETLAMRCNWSFVGLVVLIVLPLVQSQIITALGTENGYDVGGNAPICYRSYIDKVTNETDSDGSNYTAIELLNDGLFDANAKGESDATLLRSVRGRTMFFVHLLY